MKQIEVREGKYVWIVGIGTILTGLLLLFLYLYAPVDSLLMEVLCCLVAAVIILLGSGICLHGYHHRLNVEDMQIQYVNWIGKKTVFSLDEIGYVKTTLTYDGGKDYLKIYNLLGEKVGKLTYNMKGCYDFLQYLADNQVKIEGTKEAKESLHAILNCRAVCEEEIKGLADQIYEESKEMVKEWLHRNKKLDICCEMGVVSFLEEKILQDRQLWEQPSFVPEDGQSLPEGYMMVLEGYLLKEGNYILNKKNWAVGFYVPIVRVTKSMQVGEELRIRFYESALEQLQEQLQILETILPANRYHTEKIKLAHDLLDRVD